MIKDITERRRFRQNQGFSLVELTAVMGIIVAIVLITVPLYKGYVERATKQVCNTNCLQLERMYHAYLLTENKDHTAYEFNEYSHYYEENICPVNGDIVYVYGKVRCILHSKDEANENDDDEDVESVPFL
ncbi:MAG: type II secretion system protein [Pelotomaculum sp.]|jgi:Tfp pilus assembly protein PilE